MKMKNKEYCPEIDFCKDCPFYGEPNGCNRTNGECDNYDKFLEIYEDLQNYKKAEEDGLLLKLPCKLGSKFYYICYDEIIEKEVYDISFTADGYIRISAGDGVCYYLGAYGDKIFFDLEDAENEIKQIKG